MRYTVLSLAAATAAVGAVVDVVGGGVVAVFYFDCHFWLVFFSISSFPIRPFRFTFRMR